MRSSSRWFVGMLLLNLALGIVVGVLIDQTLLHPAEANPAPSAQPGSAPRRGHGMFPGPVVLDHLKQELQLDESQAQAVQQLLDSHRAKLRQFRENQQEGFRRMTLEFQQGIEVLLSPDQHARFREMRKRIEEKWRDGGGWPRRPGDPSRPHDRPPHAGRGTGWREGGGMPPPPPRPDGDQTSP